MAKTRANPYLPLLAFYVTILTAYGFNVWYFALAVDVWTAWAVWFGDLLCLTLFALAESVNEEHVVDPDAQYSPRFACVLLVNAFLLEDMRHVGRQWRRWRHGTVI